MIGMMFQTDIIFINCAHKPADLTSRRELDVTPAGTALRKNTVGFRVLRGGGFRGPWVLGSKHLGIRAAKRP